MVSKISVSTSLCKGFWALWGYYDSSLRAMARITSASCKIKQNCVLFSHIKCLRQIETAPLKHSWNQRANSRRETRKNRNFHTLLSREFWPMIGQSLAKLPTAQPWCPGHGSFISSITISDSETWYHHYLLGPGMPGYRLNNGRDCGNSSFSKVLAWKVTTCNHWGPYRNLGTPTCNSVMWM